MIIDVIKKSVPEYKVKLPGLNKTFSYRPMLVKRRKVFIYYNDCYFFI